MLSLEDIKSIYSDPALIEKTEENVAVGLNSQSRVITLVDGRIKYKQRGNHELYIPGKSYILPFRTVRETVLSRQKIVIEGLVGKRNIYPEIVGVFVKGLDPIEYYRKKEGFWRIERVIKSELEELTNFSKICRDRTKVFRTDSDGFTVLQSLNPIRQITTGYELDGVFHSTDTIGKISPPLEIEANEAEFSFLSKGHAKIVDSDGKVGKIREGILTLTNPSINVDSINYKIEREIGESLRANTYALKNALAGASTGFYVGAIMGAFIGVCPLTALVVNTPYYLEHYKESILTITLGFGVGCSLWFCTLAYLDSRRLGVPKILREKASETGTINMAFYGNVKNKRLENIEDILKNKSSLSE